MPRALAFADADHTEAAVRADLHTCEALFPEALLVGDDWQWLGVRNAVRAFSARRLDLQLHSHPKENWWWLEKVCLLDVNKRASLTKRQKLEFQPGAATRHGV